MPAWGPLSIKTFTWTRNTYLSCLDFFCHLQPGNSYRQVCPESSVHWPVFVTGPKIQIKCSWMGDWALQWSWMHPALITLRCLHHRKNSLSLIPYPSNNFIIIWLSVEHVYKESVFWHKQERPRHPWQLQFSLHIRSSADPVFAVVSRSTFKTRQASHWTAPVRFLQMRGLVSTWSKLANIMATY